MNRTVCFQSGFKSTHFLINLLARTCPFETEKSRPASKHRDTTPERRLSLNVYQLVTDRWKMDRWAEFLVKHQRARARGHMGWLFQLNRYLYLDTLGIFKAKSPLKAFIMFLTAHWGWMFGRGHTKGMWNLVKQLSLVPTRIRPWNLHLNQILCLEVYINFCALCVFNRWICVYAVMWRVLIICNWLHMMQRSKERQKYQIKMFRQMCC